MIEVFLLTIVSLAYADNNMDSEGNEFRIWIRCKYEQHNETVEYLQHASSSGYPLYVEPIKRDMAKTNYSAYIVYGLLSVVYFVPLTYMVNKVFLLNSMINSLIVSIFIVFIFMGQLGHPLLCICVLGIIYESRRSNRDSVTNNVV